MVNFAIKASEEQVYLLFRAVAKSRHYVVLPQKCGVCDAYLESESGKSGQKGEKRQKRAEKGRKGNLNKSIPFGPLYSPLVRFVPL